MSAGRAFCCGIWLSSPAAVIRTTFRRYFQRFPEDPKPCFWTSFPAVFGQFSAPRPPSSQQRAPPIFSPPFWRVLAPNGGGSALFMSQHGVVGRAISIDFERFPEISGGFQRFPELSQRFSVWRQRQDLFVSWSRLMSGNPGILCQILAWLLTSNLSRTVSKKVTKKLPKSCQDSYRTSCQQTSKKSPQKTPKSNQHVTHSYQQVTNMFSRSCR